MQSSTVAILQSANLFLFTMHNPVRWNDPTGLFAEDAFMYCPNSGARFRYVNLNNWVQSRMNWSHLDVFDVTWGDGIATIIMASAHGIAGHSFTVGSHGTHMRNGQMYVRDDLLHGTFGEVQRMPGLILTPVEDTIVLAAMIAGLYGYVSIVRWLLRPPPAVANQTVTSNLGNVIDITPSSNHSIAQGNPIRGLANSSVDIKNSKGQIVTRRWFDANGNQIRDVDFTNHMKPHTHPEVPHVHGPRSIR